jgi:hypothetical protein
VKKSEFKEGDLCVHIAIDAVLDTDLEEFRDFKLKEEKFIRIKTKKIRGVVSQGLILPIEKIKHLLNEEQKELREDMDLTSVLNIKKYISADELATYESKDCSVQLISRPTREFPSWIPRTQELRIQ